MYTKAAAMCAACHLDPASGSPLLLVLLLLPTRETVKVRSKQLLPGAPPPPAAKTGAFLAFYYVVGSVQKLARTKLH